MDLSEMILTDVLACNRINVSSGTVVKRENRPQYAIAVKTSGKTIYYSNGKEYLSDSNHICLLPKGATYSFNCIESGECLMLEFMCRLNAFEPCSIETNRTEEIIRCFRLAESSAASKKEGWKLQVFASLYSIFSILIEENEYRTEPNKRLLLPALKYIEENIQKSSITNEYLASLCSISTVYFRKLFVKYYFMPPIAYLNHIRIEKAKELLLGDYQSIEQVSLAVGYNSIYHFSKIFKQKTGVCPSQYCKALQANREFTF